MTRYSDGVPPPWLTLVGIGEDGPAGLTPAASQAIAAAETVFGGARHLALAASLVKGEATPWPSPFSIEPVLARRGRATVVLASGDPFLHGVGAVLARHLDSAELRTLPAPSAFSLAANRLGWPLGEIVTLTLHGRPIEMLRPHLHPGARLLALTSDAAAPAAIAALLTADGFGPSRMTVLEALGGTRERIRSSRADGFAATDSHPLNVVALTVAATPGARILPRAAGLDDALFEHDGQISKREIRALTLSALAPRPGQHLVDIGAGSGSIAIEWLLAAPAMQATAIEPRADRAARIRRNALAFGVPQLALREGKAPEALAGLQADAVFIGGGATQAGVLHGAMALLTSGGRLVANAVTLETEQLILDAHARLGGGLIRIAIDRAEPLAGMTGWTPARPLMQWSWTKP